MAGARRVPCIASSAGPADEHAETTVSERVLALDPGTHCGWACSCNARALGSFVHVPRGDRSGVYHVPKDERIGMRFNAFRTWLASMLRDHEVVAYEKAFVMPRGASTELFFGFIAILQEETAVRNIELVPVNAMRLKKWTTGKGRASKADMLAAAQFRWKLAIGHERADCPKWCPDPSHDEADAIAILHHVQETRHASTEAHEGAAARRG